MCLSFSLKTERNFWPTLWYQEVSRKEYLKEYFPGFGNAQIIFISRQNYVSLWPASFCTPRPNLSVIPGISWLPTFAFQYPVMKRTSFLVTANTLQQHKRRLYTWTSKDDLYQNQIDYILLGQRWRSTIQSAKKKTGRWLWLRSLTPYCQIQTEIEESGENHWTIQVWPKLNPLQLYNGSDK